MGGPDPEAVTRRQGRGIAEGGRRQMHRTPGECPPQQAKLPARAREAWNTIGIPKPKKQRVSATAAGDAGALGAGVPKKIAIFVASRIYIPE